jgi:insertion element IS1 protein InsB
MFCSHLNDVEQVKRHGTTKNGTQRFRCYASRKCFLKDYTKRGRMPEVKARMAQMNMIGDGIRDTSLVIKVNRNTLMNHF